MNDFIYLPIHKNSLFSDPVIGQLKSFFVQKNNKIIAEYNENVSYISKEQDCIYLYGNSKFTIDVTNIVNFKCTNYCLLVPSNKNRLFSDPCYMENKIFQIEYPWEKKILYKENEIVKVDIVNGCKFHYGNDDNYINVSNIVNAFKFLHLPLDKNSLFGDPIPYKIKHIYILFENEKLLQLPESESSNVLVPNQCKIYYGDDEHKINITDTICKYSYQIFGYPNVVMVFICHNDASLQHIVPHLDEYNNYAILVGTNSVKEEYLNHPKIFISQSYSDNIEHENRLLTFTAWYTIVKNNLFADADYLCLIEYDCKLLDENFIYTLHQKCYETKQKVYSFITYPGCFYAYVEPSIIHEFCHLKNMNLNNFSPDFRWNTTTNHCIKRELLYEFVDWYYPDCLMFKNKDPCWFSFYHERLFALYIQVNKIYFEHINWILDHQQSDSHFKYFIKDIQVDDFDWRIYRKLNIDKDDPNYIDDEHYIENEFEEILWTRDFMKYGYNKGLPYKLIKS